MKLKYKVGDSVAVVATEDSDHVFDGEVGVITEVDIVDEVQPYWVQFAPGEGWWCRQADLSLLGSPRVIRAKKGMRVRVVESSDPSSPLHPSQLRQLGRVGTVADGHSVLPAVRFADGTCLPSIHISKLMEVPEEEEEGVSEPRRVHIHVPEALQSEPCRVTNGYPDDNPKSLVGTLKAPLHLVPPALTIGAAEALEDGAKKYGEYNFRSTRIAASVYIGAIQRHLLALQDGEDLASDSGIHHVKHIAASCAIYLDSLAHGNLVDDRPESGPGADLLAEYLDRKSEGADNDDN